MAGNRSTVPRYVPGLINHAQRVAKLGEIRIVTVLHDDDCPRPIGGRCDCQPEIELLNRRERRMRGRKRGS